MILAGSLPYFQLDKDMACLCNATDDLYKYNPKTGSLKKVFDERLDEIHKWIVIDLAKTNNGYLLLVTDSDLGIGMNVWKLTSDGALERDFLETKLFSN